MGAFYLAMPLGTAFGYGIGGLIDARFGWHAAFLVVGLPGLLLAFAGLGIANPDRGATEERTTVRRSSSASREIESSHSGAAEDRRTVRPTWSDYLGLARNRTFLFNTAGMAAVTFTTGAFGHWMPTYYQTVRGMPKEHQIQIGAPLAAAGIIGVLIGMRVPDRLLKITPRAYLIWAGLAVLAAIPFGVCGLLIHSFRGSIVLMFFASIFLTSCLGPCNAVTANVVPANQRSVGFAVSIFILHLIGDVPSPPLIGGAGRPFREARSAHSAFTRFLERFGAADRHASRTDEPHRRHALDRPGPSHRRPLLPRRLSLLGSRPSPRRQTRRTRPRRRAGLPLRTTKQTNLPEGIGINATTLEDI